MNQIIKTIKARRSVRSYETKSVPRELLQTVIEAGNEAPSAMNSQPWRFVVVEDKEVKRKAPGRRNAPGEKDNRDSEGH